MPKDYFKNVSREEAIRIFHTLTRNEQRIVSRQHSFCERDIQSYARAYMTRLHFPTNEVAPYPHKLLNYLKRF